MARKKTDGKTYKQCLNVQNFQLAHYMGVGRWNIPPIYNQVTDYEPCTFLDFGAKIPEDGVYGCHFFLDDHLFQRVWNNPTMQLNKLRRYKYVLAPDFSLFIDYPKALSLYNHYRKHWCARFWQDNGINVIPVARWMYRDSWEWCFDGEPRGGIVAVSSKGINNDASMIEMFRAGYDAMEKVLHPKQVLWFGKYCLTEMRDNITLCKTGFEDRIAMLRANHARIPKYKLNQDQGGDRSI